MRFGLNQPRQSCEKVNVTTVDLNAVDVLERKYRGHNPIRTLLALCFPEKRNIGIASVFFLLKQMPAWLFPLVTANMVDILVYRKPLWQLFANAVFIGLLILQNWPNHVLFVKYLSRANRTIEIKLRSALAVRLQQLSISYHSRTSSGMIQAKVLRDVENIQQMIAHLGESGWGAIVMLLMSIIITSFRAPEFLPFFFIVVPFVSFLITKMRNSINVKNQEFREEIESMSSQVNEMTTLFQITRAHGLEEDALRRVGNTFSKVRFAGTRLDLVNANFGSLSWVIFQVANFSCLTFACWACYSGKLDITAGDVVMLSGYFTSIVNSIIALTGLGAIITKGLQSVRSLGEILESPDVEMNEGKTVVSHVTGEISFHNVSYKYLESERYAVTNLELIIPAGETIALVGTSGSGKSTIINLVLGFARPTEGYITCDKRRLDSLDMRTLRKFVSIVPQETVLFNASIRDNITYGLAGVTESEVATALQMANAQEFVDQMSEGLDTQIGEGGASLSGGQRQRVAIARAIIRDPKILILDEATSALDTESELLIQDALFKLRKNRTTFIVAHRLSTVRDADRIIVLEDGKIVEIGTHRVLIEQNGRYAELVSAQNILS